MCIRVDIMDIHKCTVIPRYDQARFWTFAGLIRECKKEVKIPKIITYIHVEMHGKMITRK